MKAVTDQKKRFGILIRVFFLLLILALVAAVMVFGRSKAETELSSAPVLVTQAPQVDVLMPGDRFTGMLRITNHKGKGYLKNGSYAVRGLLDRNEEGSFFELYGEDDPEGLSPLLTMYVTIDYNTLIPRIGTEDARFFYIWLDERDIQPLTMKLTGGRLAASYFYDDGSETCQIDFSIKQEK